MLIYRLLLHKTKCLFYTYSALKGINAVILGYGQTGTGKSTTMHGLHSAYRVSKACFSN